MTAQPIPSLKAGTEMLWCSSCEMHVEPEENGLCGGCDEMLDADAFRVWWWSDQRGWAAEPEVYSVWKD